MTKALFWIVWFIVCSWVVRNFYYTYRKKNVQNLRYLALLFNLLILAVFLFPWLPKDRGGLSGWQLLVSGKPEVIMFFLFLVVSLALFLTKNQKLLKAGAVVNVINSVFIIILFMRLLPGKIHLTFRESAPIVAAIVLLANNVVVLLLWHQLQLGLRKKERRKTK